MSEKRFSVFKSEMTGLFVVNDNTHEFTFEGVEDAGTIMKLVGLLNNYIDENEQLKQYKQAVSDVLKNWSQKNLSAKQLQVVIAIMEELNVMGELK